MWLPNLLEHETLDEAIQQSSAWISLFRLHCHSHTKVGMRSGAIYGRIMGAGANTTLMMGWMGGMDGMD